MSPTQHNPDPLNRLLGDVLSSADVSPEQLVQYAEHPDTLSADDRAHIESCLRESAELRDELRVLQQFNPAPAAFANATPPAKAPPTGSGWLQNFIDRLDDIFGKMMVPVGAVAIITMSVAVLVVFNSEQQPDGLVDSTPPTTDNAPDATLDTLPQNQTPGDTTPIDTPPEQLADQSQQPAPPTTVDETLNDTQPQLESPDHVGTLMLAMIEPQYLSAYPAESPIVIRGENKTLRALAPAMANTASNQPVIYWTLPKLNARALLLFEISDESSGELIKSKSIDVPEKAGRQSIDLAQLNVNLDPGIEYQWSIIVQKDINNPALDEFTSAKIKFVKPSTQFSQQIASAKPGEIANLYAQQGYWYDALHHIVKLEKQFPDNADVEKTYRGMLEQLGNVAGE